MSRTARSHTRCAAAAVLWIAVALACDVEKAATPIQIEARYHAMLDSLDVHAPGAAIERLNAFLTENAGYQIADSARAERKRFLAAAEGRYHMARSLARDGDFDVAEDVLQDLARAPETPDGENAQRHLEFEFYIEKARWLMIHQRFDESEAVARSLLSRKLTPVQVDEVEKVLDYTAQAQTVVGMAARERSLNACRQLMVLLATIYAEEGEYPSSFSMSDLEERDSQGGRFITGTLTSIEDYEATRDSYSLVAVSSTGERFRIVDGQLQE